MVLVAVLIIAIVFSASLFIPLLWWWRSRRLGDLQEPLLEPIQYRLDAAMREAAVGFSACSICGFENFKRVSLCIACGGVLSPPIAKPHVSDELSIITAEYHVATMRERRARKRKQWTRRVDAQGRCVWRRKELDNDRTSDNDAFVVHFQVPAEEAQAPASDQGPIELVVESEPKGRARKDSFIIPTRKELVQRVRDDFKGVSMHILRVNYGHEAQFHVSCSVANAFPALQSATQAFPIKYAEFVTKATVLQVPSEEHRLTLHLARENLWEDSIETLSALKTRSIRWALRINYVNEAGIDAGGLTREWFGLMNEAMVDPANGVFQCVNKSDQSYYLNRHSESQVGKDHLLYFLGAGRLIGRALLEGSTLGFHLSLPLLKIILGVPVSLDDLEFYDPELYRSLLWIKENDGVGQLGLDFSITEQIGDELVIVDLIPNGRSINVDDGNKAEFLKRKLHYLLFESVSSQLYMFLKGIYDVAPQELLIPFDVEEFDYLLSGTDEIDVDDWERNTTNVLFDPVERADEPGCHHAVRRWFWEIVREMPNEYRRRLLQFATGSSRVPLSGFRALTSYDDKLCAFTLKVVKLTGDGCITSHACFNRLDLPLHSSRAKLNNVLYAILDTDVYGFTMD